MPDVTWTTENMIQLVQEYRKLPQLWNRDHDLYRVASAKYEAWSSLAQLFSCDIVDLRKKFNSILASRRREKAKVREGGRSTWFLYPHLSFLHGHIEQPEFEMNIVRPIADEDDDPPSDHDVPEDYEEEVTIKEEPLIRATSSSTRHAKKRRRTLPNKLERSPSPEEEQIVGTHNLNLDLKMSEIIKLLRHNDSKIKKKDECDTFGEYIASSLRNHDDKTRSMIKQAINNILFEQEMKKYNNGTFTVILETEPADNPLADHTASAVHLVEDSADVSEHKTHLSNIK